jgi:hypothetical protein
MQLFNALCPAVQKRSNSNKIEHFALTYLEPLLSQTDTHFIHISSTSDTTVVPDTDQSAPYLRSLQLTTTQNVHHQQTTHS